MPREYVHELKSVIHSISGSYELEYELTVEMDRKTVLCIIGTGIVDNSCCGVGGCRFALVPGYVLSLKIYRNDEGLWVSQVESIGDEELRGKITNILKKQELVQQVQFL